MATLLGTNLVGACLDDGTQNGKDSTGETEQQVLDYGQTGMNSCSTRSGCAYSLGASNGFSKVCYISGLKGDLYGSYVYLDFNDNNTDYLKIIPGPGRTVSASAACTDIDGSHVGGGTWSVGQPNVSLGAGSGTQCAITSLLNTSGFQNNTDLLRVAQDSNGNWNLGGSMASGHYATATATCWTPSSPTGGFSWQNFSGPVTNPFSPLTNGMICAPTKFQGNFTHATSEVSVGINNALAEWYLTVSYTAGTASCFF